jgi:hypothetical protein
VAFVIAANLRRRDLSASQKACIAVEIEPMFAEEAKKRADEGRIRGGQARHSSAVAILPPSSASCAVHAEQPPGRRFQTGIRRDPAKTWPATVDVVGGHWRAVVASFSRLWLFRRDRDGVSESQRTSQRTIPDLWGFVVVMTPNVGVCGCFGGMPENAAP